MKSLEDKDLMEVCKASQDGRLKKQMDMKSSKEKKIFEIEYEYPYSVSADWLMRLFNNPKVKVKELNALDKPKDKCQCFPFHNNCPKEENIARCNCCGRIVKNKKHLHLPQDMSVYGKLPDLIPTPLQKR